MTVEYWVYILKYTFMFWQTFWNSYPSYNVERLTLNDFLASKITFMCFLSIYSDWELFKSWELGLYFKIYIFGLAHFYVGWCWTISIPTLNKILTLIEFFTLKIPLSDFCTKLHWLWLTWWLSIRVMYWNKFFWISTFLSRVMLNNFKSYP